jgi:hypothetical protein
MYLFNYQSDNHMVYLITIGTFNFLFHFKVSHINRMMYATAQLIGTTHSAEKWIFELHLYNKNEPRKKYHYSDICHSDKTSLEEIIAAGECAMIPISYAETFDALGKLTYKFYIKRENNDKKRIQAGVRRRC